MLLGELWKFGAPSYGLSDAVEQWRLFFGLIVIVFVEVLLTVDGLVSGNGYERRAEYSGLRRLEM